MFGLFKKKSPIEKLSEQHQKMLNEARILSTTDRKASDALYEKAAEIDSQIAELQK
jgi:hypothetical protein